MQRQAILPILSSLLLSMSLATFARDGRGAGGEGEKSSKAAKEIPNDISQAETSDKNSKSSSTAKRPWKLQDSMAVRYVALDASDPTLTAILPGRERASVVISPDGEFFFFIVTGGDLEADADVGILVVYRTRSIQEWLARPGLNAPPAPYRSIAFRSRDANVATLTSPAWDEDSRGVVFLATLDGHTEEGFRLDVASGELDRLSRRHSPDSYLTNLVARGAGGIYTESMFPRNFPTRYPVEWVKRNADGSVPSYMASRFQEMESNLYASFRGRLVRVSPMAPGVSSLQPWLSPSGGLAIARSFGSARPLLLLIDLRTGGATFLPGTVGESGALYEDTRKPMPESSVFWSQDGTRAILVNVTPQSRETALSTRGGEERNEDRLGGGASVDARNGGAADSGRPFAAAEAETEPGIFEYEVRSGQWKMLEPLKDVSSGIPRHVSAVGWYKPGQELLVTHDVGGLEGEKTLYSFSEAGVVSQLAGAAVGFHVPGAELIGGMKVWVEQSANAPPRIMVSDGRRKALLSDINPQLRRVQLLKTETFTWREPDGGQGSGGLTLPAGYRIGKRVPLVIQAYRFEPKAFLPDGFARASDAAQALAARGMAVLQLDIRTPTPSNPIAEGPFFVQRIDAAVETLVNQGIVDPERVGATGFSRGGFQVFYAVTHPGRVPLAAAMGADFFTGSYAEYLGMASFDGSSPQISFESGVGGSFWQQKSKWLQYEPTFNLDRSVTPFLMTTHGVNFDDQIQVRNDDASYVRQIIGAFVLTNKPLEYLYFGYSPHSLLRPLERVASLEAMVDWMSFWLQDNEYLTTLNDRLCSRPDVIAAKGPDLSAHVDAAGQPSDSKNDKPWFWLDCTKEGISKACADREAMYARWRPLREQQTRSVEAMARLPKTKFIEVPEDFDVNLLPKITRPPVSAH